MDSELVPPGLTYLADNIVSSQNILGVTREQSARWAQDLGLPRQSETVLFAGCGYQYSAQLEKLMSTIRGIDRSVIGAELPLRFARFQKKLGLNLPEIYSRVLARSAETEVQPLEAAVRVLRKIGVQPGYLAEEEPCCGAPLYQAGRLFPEYIEGYDLEVKHFLEIVVENLLKYELRFPRQVRVTYHDPCQLVRYLNIVEEPRQILRSIKDIELVEPDWTTREYATCCGGGGGFEAVFPELSQVLAVNRTRELLETGAEIIVTHCPGCIMQLKDGLRQLKVDNVEVLDLTQVVAMAMET
jgi:hypothetical protein